MATGWVKSLQCKSRALEDVLLPNPKPLNLIPSSGCRKSVQSLKDVVDSTQRMPKRKHRHRPPRPLSPSPRPKGTFQELDTPTARAPDPFFPTLTELPKGYSSRNVVEIIFRRRWSSHKEFPGTIEMIFKVHNLPKTVDRFKEYREVVKARAGAGNPGSRREEGGRCMADGNEVMSFHCLGPTDEQFHDAGGLCTFSGKSGAIRTFPDSGGAHDSAGGGKGRRAMLVCRVIAGRVCERVDSLLDSGVGVGAFESVTGENGALVVFDSRAVLPCFLIIYEV